jgi:rhodanese-related sulfurtransferase
MSVPEVTVDELAAKRAEGAPLIDVRNPDEYEGFHVPGAVLLPLGELVERADEVPVDGTVYIICQSGGRSAKAAEHLRGLGVDAVNVAGGSKAWADAGHPVATGPEPG